MSHSAQVSLSIVLESLSLLQEFYSNRDPTASQVNTGVLNEPYVPPLPQGHQIPSDTTLVVTRDEAKASDHKILAVQGELEKILQSEPSEPDESTNPAAERHLIVHDKSGLKLVQINKSLQSLKFSKNANLVCQESFAQVSKFATCIHV